MTIEQIPTKTIVVDPGHNGVGYAVNIYLIDRATLWELKYRTINRGATYEYLLNDDFDPQEVVDKYVDMLCQLCEEGYTKPLVPEETLRLIQDEVDRRY
jgi:hypothetical protein